MLDQPTRHTQRTPMPPAPLLAPLWWQHQQANLIHGQSNATPEQQAIGVALSRIQVAQTDVEVCEVARTLAYALGATRTEVGTIKALHAVLLQMTRPGMSDMKAFKSTKASKSNFVNWKRKVLMHANALQCLPQAPTTTAVPGQVHPPLPVTTPAPPPTRAAPSAPPVAPLTLPADLAAPSAAPTAPTTAIPMLRSDLAQRLEEPIGLGAFPTAPPAASMAPTASASSRPERLSSSPLELYRGSSGACGDAPWLPLDSSIDGPVGGELRAKRANSSSASATSSAFSRHPSCSSDDSEPQPGNTATHGPTPQLAAPPLLPADLVQVFD